MSSEFGRLLRVSVFGESHGRAVGVLLDGLPAGEAVDEAELLAFLARRRPGGPLTTARREEDLPMFLSGLHEGRTNGAPLCAMIENQDARPSDYETQDVPRPSHGDYAAFAKWGAAADLRGGGHFSGRLTAPLCLGGGIAKQILARRGIHIGAHLYAVAEVEDDPFPLWPDETMLKGLGKSFPTLNEAQGERMAAAIAAAAREGDSVGGVIECAAIGLPAGLGSPMFGGMENRLAAALFGIPGVRGLGFGEGFAAARMYGSAHNDPFYTDGSGRVLTEKNSAGGINGGITNGMPLRFTLAMKPTPSIGKPQKSVRLSDGAPVELRIQGRHDPCIALRAVPVAEAVTALVLLDLYLEGGTT